ncbi:hypothetical protein KXW97_000558, partial [Aspergillus fumigatus]
ELGISCVPWESRRPPDAASIVLVTPESAVSPDFQMFLNRLQWTRRLDRIVINECHVVLNSQRDFRPQMAQLGRLVQARTQMVWLTATLPPSMEAELCRWMKHDQAAVTIYWARTSRSNVAYRVWRPDMTGVGRGPYEWIESEAVVAFIQDRIRRAAGGKVIIYANIIGQVTAMARVLGCEAYYSEQLDKAGVLARFMGASPVIAATSALGMGVDIPNIRSIIHIGTPRTLLDYAQESGRAGRDGQRSEAIIIQPAGWDALAPWMEGVAPKDQEQVAEYIGVVEGVGCRRVVLDQYLDGVVDGYQRQYCQDADPREQACNGCDPNWEQQEVDPGKAGSMVVRVAVREAPFEAASMAARAAAREAPFEAASMSARAAAREAPFEAGSQVPCEAASPTPSNNSFCSQPSIPMAVWHAQQAQAQQWAAMDIQQQQHRTQQGLDEEMAQAECMQWRDQCYICAMQGEDSGHELYACHQPHSQAARAWMICVRRQVQYAPYSACYSCGMPQSICHGWEPGHACEYRGFLIPMVAMMLFGPWQGQIKPVWQRWLQGLGVDGQDEAQVVQFFGQAHPNHEGHSQLFTSF